MKLRDTDSSYSSISRKQRRRRGHQDASLLMWILIIALLLTVLMPALSLWKNREPDDSVLLLAGKTAFYLALPFVILFLIAYLIFLIGKILFSFRKGSRIKIEKGDYAGQTGTVMEKHKWLYSWGKLKVKLDSTGQDIEIHPEYCKKTGFLSWMNGKDKKSVSKN